MPSLLDLLLPPSCPGCGREGAVLCADCGAWLGRRGSEPPGVPLGLPWPLPAGLVQLEWCAAFTGPVRDALHALKYRGERRLAGPLGEAIAERWAAAGQGGELLVHVPVHPARLRERGFDQAQDLAIAAARHLRLPAVAALERVTSTRAMHALGRDARASNVGGAFRVQPGQGRDVAGRWAILVDDVVTTGATLSGSAEALLIAGAIAVSAVTVARER